MASIQSMTLHNFKGIEEVRIDLEDRVTCPVTTLIGLNESGKTTILEGLSHFVTGDKSVSSLFDGVHANSSGTSLIPVHKKAAFTGKIKVSAEVRLNEADFVKAQKIADKQRLTINKNAFLDPFTITKTLSFEDSILTGTTNVWTFSLLVKSLKAKQERKYQRPENEEQDLWLKIANLLEEELPRISYFPTFLVDMPSRIYLREHKDEKPINRHYRFVFQDVLDSLDEGLSLEKHVCKRIDDYRQSNNSANWLSLFFGAPSKIPVDSVFQKISSTVTKEVLGSWQRVFQRTISAKNIFVEWNVDTERGNLPYASFYVTDGESRFAISERSLGFRWFFSFLLFTAFKQAKERPTIFLFDEPAANLHAKAQAELMTSFSRIVADGHRIVYSTHSHHMINPQWLSGAYIVENTALDYESDDAFGLNTKPTRIAATKYKEFVSKFPTRTSYFQPVIEKLEYVTPHLIGAAPFVIVEGITDYYALTLAILSSGVKTKFSLIPGVGASSSGPIISLLLGRGEEFLILLDDDAEGRKQAARYLEEWYLKREQVLTLGELDSQLKGFNLEDVLKTDTSDLIKTNLGIDSKPSKKQIGLYLSEMCALQKRNDALGPKTAEKLRKILGELNERFAN
jgi:predicted ATP-dependent endonuclease of OLD family